MCMLCDKLLNLPAAEVVWEFPRSVALLGPWQYHLGYCVLVARRHVAELHDLGDDERRGLLDEMTMLSRAIADTVRPRKMNLEALGNQVPHLHWHLFPRRDDDPEALKAVWVALDRAERDPAEHARLYAPEVDRPALMDRLRQSLDALRAPRR